MSAVLLLTGGPGHPADASADALEEVFGAAGLDVDASADIEAGLTRLDPRRHELLAVNALRSTTVHERDHGPGTGHACALSGTGRAAIERWHEAGHPTLSLHTGILCFDDWDGWGTLLGGRWIWERSHHPPLGPVDVEHGDRGFAVVDECYQDLEVAPDVEVIASTRAGDPLAWVRTTGPGPVGVDLLGHDARSLDDPGHRRLLADLIRRLLEARP